MTKTQKRVLLLIPISLVFFFCCTLWSVLDIPLNQINWKAVLTISRKDWGELWEILRDSTNRENQAPRQSISGPHPDGIYTVGSEISTGTWESQGTGDRCYWAIRDRNQETTKNYFGKAGGNVTLKSSHYEFFSEHCGTWYLK